MEIPTPNPKNPKMVLKKPISQKPKPKPQISLFSLQLPLLLVHLNIVKLGVKTNLEELRGFKWEENLNGKALGCGGAASIERNGRREEKQWIDQE